MAKMIEIQELEELENDKKFKQYMNPGRAKYIRQVDGPKVYPMGRHSFDKIARQAGAVLKVCGMVIIDTQLFDKFLDDNFREDSTLF
ncbi:MAG: DUF6462 family protein [Clostridiales bacterium]|nr:DUF6462 family protein [Clostridiales bacterium]